MNNIVVGGSGADGVSSALESGTEQRKNANAAIVFKNLFTRIPLLSRFDALRGLILHAKMNRKAANLIFNVRGDHLALIVILKETEFVSTSFQIVNRAFHRVARDRYMTVRAKARLLHRFNRASAEEGDIDFTRLESEDLCKFFRSGVRLADGMTIQPYVSHLETERNLDRALRKFGNIVPAFRIDKTRGGHEASASRNDALARRVVLQVVEVDAAGSDETHVVKRRAQSVNHLDAAVKL